MKMKSVFAGASALGLAIAMASSASAVELGQMGSATLKQNDPDYSQPSPRAGEFTVYNISGLPTGGYAASTRNVSDAPSFQSFCLERDQQSTGVNFYKVNSAAVGGGSGGPSPDPLSVGTAWLYCHFATGELEGYDYTPGDGRRASAVELQRAIWALEEETTPAVGNFYYDLAQAKFEGGAMADARPGQFGVYVLNTYAGMDEAGNLFGPRQDQVYYTPVPDGGATVMLLGLALSGFGLARRFIGSKA